MTAGLESSAKEEMQSLSNISAVERSWLKTLDRLGGRNAVAANKWFNAIVDRYEGQAHRAVHNMDNMIDTLQLYDDLIWINDFDDSAEVRMALWFQRFVITPDGTEAADLRSSATAVMSCLNDVGVPSLTSIKRISDLLIHPVTAAQNSPTNWKIYHDISLDYLGESPRSFSEYCEGARKEYYLVPGREYAARRMSFLHSLLKDGRDGIYLTDEYKRMFGTTAYVNVEKSLQDILEWIDYMPSLALE